MERYSVFCYEADGYVSGFSPPGISFTKDVTRSILFYGLDGAEGLISALSDFYDINFYDTDFEVVTISL